ncbi:cadherin repeat domain-containing protein, partial [Alphaproteobacteria bacterium]|nr:cadherin repeat domain-containing protein [Alphaproteobacteria bacterium]
MANLLSSFLNGSSTFTYNNGTNVIPSYTLVQPTFSNTSTGASIFNQTFGSSSSFGNSLLFGSSLGGSTLTGSFGNSFNVGGFNTSFNYGSLGNGFGFGTVARTTTTTTTTTNVNLLTSVDTDQDTDFPFVASDFEFPDGTAIGSIQIVDVPANGTLELNGSEVDEGDIIAAADLDELDYVPDQYFDQTDSFVVNLSTDGTTYDTTNYTIEIDVEGENDAPDVAAISTVGITEGETASDIGSLIVASVSDVDTDDSLGTVTITDLPATANGSLKYTSDAGGTVTITSGNTTISASEAATLVFESNSDIVDGSTDPDTTIDLEIKFTVTEDGLAGSSGGTVNIQISDGNDAPTIRSDFDPTVEVFENETIVGTLKNPATDEETSNTLSYSITGVDAEYFNIDSANGEITFRSAPDYENPTDSNKDNAYIFNLVAEDDGGLTAATEVTVTVDNLPGSVALTVPAATTVEEGVRAAFTATAATDDTSNDLTFSIGDTGVDGDLFDIDASDGTVSFKSTPDAEDPQDSDVDNVYELEIIVTDSRRRTPTPTVPSSGVTDSSSVTLTVEDLDDENPSFLGFSLWTASSSATATIEAKNDTETSSITISNDDEGSLEISMQEISGVTSASSSISVSFWNGEFSTIIDGTDLQDVIDQYDFVENLTHPGEFT